ncbi:restriction endonuclease subunit S [Aeromonas salmonicida]|uniref:restriction endonuclease subunit S n=1 Tax=Aeromonas salmonicida TaxID=645 RepID=UPI0038BC3B25
MKAGWQFETLGDVCELINRGVSPKYLEQGGVCVLNQKCIRDHQVNYELARRHDLAAKKVNNDRFIQVGDVLVNSTGTGTLGRVAQIRKAPEEPTTVDSHVTIVRPKPKKFFQDFFGYMLIFIEEAIKAAGEGCGGQTELARSVLANNFTVAYPSSLVEQQRIVVILDKAFEAIAAARANAEQNRQNARALFESYLQSVFSQRGEGWEEKSLEELGTITSSKRIFKSEYVKSGVPFYRTKEIKELANGRDITTELFISEVRYREIKTGFGVPKEGDVLLTAIGTIGEAWVVEGNSDFYFKDGNVLWLKEFTSIIPRFLKYVLQSFVESLNKMSHGSAYSALPIQRLNAHKIFLPSLAEQEQIVSTLDSLYEETQRLESLYERKIAALDELKQSLLQQAFSGNL